MPKEKLTFIDLFAGCGGLSLGLMKAGLKGIFAIEKTPDAFSTLIHNLTPKKVENGFDWPVWLPCKNMTTKDLLDNYPAELEKLAGKVDVVAGGPPCQGFSFAGLRNPLDPRNRLTEEYIKIVSILKPKALLLENVKGFQAAFKKNGEQGKCPVYSERVVSELEKVGIGYRVFRRVFPASDFGVPQPRPRFVMIAVRNDIAEAKRLSNMGNEDFCNFIMSISARFKKKHGLDSAFTPLKDAISDLETRGKPIIDCIDSKGFKQISYKQPKPMNPYLAFLRKDTPKNCIPNSLRIPNHKKSTVGKFSCFIENSPKGHTLSRELREKMNIKKQCITVLSPDKLSTTITTLPDDCIHYSEPRILTVRENARIQSFPDWFEFKGKYTTGGSRRKQECPRYTQVGNAVPPLMAEILGTAIRDIVGDSNG